MPMEIIHAFGYLKKAAAHVNCDLGVLSRTKRDLHLASLRRNRRRRERERRILAKSQVFVRVRGRLADPRPVGMETFEAPKGLIETEFVGLFVQTRVEAQSVRRRPIVAGHRITSPRLVDWITVSVNELIDTYRAKN